MHKLFQTWNPSMHEINKCPVPYTFMQHSQKSGHLWCLSLTAVSYLRYETEIWEPKSYFSLQNTGMISDTTMPPAGRFMNSSTGLFLTGHYNLTSVNQFGIVAGGYSALWITITITVRFHNHNVLYLLIRL